MAQSSDEQETDWIKVDLHIHTLDDPKDALDYSAHELLERARALGFRVLAITLHDAVFDRAEVFADAARMGILLIPAAEVRLEGADVILLNVRASEIESLRSLDDLQELRRRRGQSLFTIAPHPFYILGHSIGAKLIERIDCFDAIELCHFGAVFSIRIDAPWKSRRASRNHWSRPPTLTGSMRLGRITRASHVRRS